MDTNQWGTNDDGLPGQALDPTMDTCTLADIENGQWMRPEDFASKLGFPFPFHSQEPTNLICGLRAGFILYRVA